ncbi:MAG: NUDIX domain-containing protein [Succinivibrio sp.]|nr:NUDIX domain-containing protein [Succinivibrio sp.]
MSDTQKLFAPRFTIKDVHIQKQERLFEKFFAIDNYTLSYRKFDGSEGRVVQREIFERGHDAVAVLPYDAVTDEVMLIEQFRPGALRDPVSPWLIEVVAGMIDEGESEIEAVIRELDEETGTYVTPSQLHYITAQYPTPGGCSERTSLYIADCDLSHIKNHGGLETENEDIRIFKVPAPDAFRECFTGRICNAAALITLLTLQLKHREYRELFAGERR